MGIGVDLKVTFLTILQNYQMLEFPICTKVKMFSLFLISKNVAHTKAERKNYPYILFIFSHCQAIETMIDNGISEFSIFKIC